MKRIVAIAALAIIGPVVHPSAATIDRPLVRRLPGYALVPVSQNTAFVWNGRWQGTTASGGQLVLQLQREGDHLTGRLTVGKQSAKIVYGKVVDEAFAFTTGPIDGHSVDATGRRVGDALELTIEGARDPLTLTRLV
jgi:hypothetical protein